MKKRWTLHVPAMLALRTHVIIYIKSFKCFRLLPRTVDEEICFLHVSVCLNEVEIYDQVD